MNVVLFYPDQRQGAKVFIQDQSTLAHLNRVLKLKVGDQLRVGEVNGLLGQANISQLSNEHCELDVLLDSQPPAKIPCSLILALPRPQQLKRILVHLASLGVKELHLLQTDKVEKNYWQSPTLINMEKYLLEGLQQAKDTVLPKLECHKDFASFMKKNFQTITYNKTTWLAHPGEFQSPQTQTQGEHVILVGPEGGFSQQEVSLFQEKACTPLSLGKRILKTETAIPLLLGKMFY